VDGFMQRSPFEFLVNARLDYTFKIGKSQRLLVSADVFNAFDNQSPTAYDVYHELQFGVPNPNFGQPLVLAASQGGPAPILPSFQTPRQVRLGLRFEW
jgi:outer membrane receptor protein involved in Fe transport